MEENNLDTLGNRLHHILKIKNLSQTKFSTIANVTNSHISKIIKGTANPSPALLEKICNILFINRDWLENGMGEINKFTFSSEYINAFNKFNKLDTRFQNFILIVLELLLKVQNDIKENPKN